MNRTEKAALATMFFGSAALVVGAVVFGRSRRGFKQQHMLGDVQARVKRGGMTLTHHFDTDMPIQKRVKLIQDLVFQGVKQPQMRELALAITGRGVRDVQVGKRRFRVRGADCPARDGLCEAEAVFHWTKSNLRYTGDIAPVKFPTGEVEGIDLFQSGLRSVEFGGGDCDDHSILNSTLLALNGIPPQVRITAPRKNSDWAHIYALAGLPKTNPAKWVALDTTLPGDNMFSREANFGKKLDFPA